jgi:hypothetical protein
LTNVTQYLVNANRVLGPHPVENAADHPWRLEEDEEGQHPDCDERDDAADDRLADGKGGAAEAADQGLEPRHVLLDIALEVQPFHEVPNLSLAVLSLADKVRQLLREARSRRVDRVHEHIPHRHRDRRREEEHDSRRDPPADPPALHETDNGVQERTEEQRHDYQQDNDPEPPQEGKADADAHDCPRGDERSARHP